MYRCQYTVGDLSLIEGQIGDVYWAHQLAPPPSLLWFCNKCGTVYARLYVYAATDWRSITARCESCEPSLFHVPGSIIPVWPDELFKALPYEVLVWEYNCHVKWFEALYGDQECKQENISA